jgi:cell division septation protein DedD
LLWDQIIGSVVLVGLDVIVVALVVAADEPEAAPFGTNVAEKVKATSKFAILGGILEGSK